MTVTTSWATQSEAVSSAAIVSGALTVLTGDYITVAFIGEDNNATTTFTVSNTNTAIVWTQRAATNTGSNCKVVMWSGTAGATPPTTVTVTATAGSNVTTTAKALLVCVHTGQHGTTPLPAGNIFSGTGGTDISQVITPTSSGSALWFVAGDWAQTNSYTVLANCSLVAAAFNRPGRYTAVAIQPTTQPRTNAVAFTIGETDTAGTIAWIAWEVQSAVAAAIATPDVGVGLFTGLGSSLGLAVVLPDEL